MDISRVSRRFLSLLFCMGHQKVQREFHVYLSPKSSSYRRFIENFQVMFLITLGRTFLSQGDRPSEARTCAFIYQRRCSWKQMVFGSCTTSNQVTSLHALILLFIFALYVYLLLFDVETLWKYLNEICLFQRTKNHHEFGDVAAIVRKFEKQRYVICACACL